MFKDLILACERDLSGQMSTYFDTQTWRAPVAEVEDKALTEVQNAVDVIATTFREPLEAVGVRILELQDEITEVLEYSRQYLSIETDGYKSVWYKLHVCPDAVRWENVILLCELCFSLPFSNGCIERMFSALKLVKTDRRTQLSHQMLTDILEIRLEGPPLEDFSPNKAVETWWNDSTRRPNQSTRNRYAPRSGEGSTSTSITIPDEAESDSTLSLDEWDSWFDN